MLVTKGSTDVSVNIRIVDETDGTPETAVEHNTTGIDLWYRREGAAVSSITEVALAALTTAHTDGGIEHISHGWYRLDVPDAAFASGVDGVQIGGTVTGMIVHAPYVQLTDVDLFDAVRGGMTALPNVNAGSAGGLPDDTDANGAVRVVSGTGAREISLSSGLVDLTTNALDSTSLDATAITDIWAKVCETEGSYTAQQIMSIVLSVLAGETNTNGTVFRTPNDAATRVSATVDASDNRTAMTLTPSS